MEPTRGPGWRAAIAAIVACAALAATPGGALASPRGHDSCWNCHFGAASASNAGAPAAPRTLACVSCHVAPDESGRPLAAAGPHRDLPCVACHDPHAARGSFRMAGAGPGVGPSDERFDRETRTCIRCHAAATSFRDRDGDYVQHPVGIGAPLHDGRVVDATKTGAAIAVAAPDAPGDAVVLPLAVSPGAPAGVIGCGTCHSVHGSKDAYLLRWSRPQTVAACASCHQESVAPVVPAAPLAFER